MFSKYTKVSGGGFMRGFRSMEGEPISEEELRRAEEEARRSRDEDFSRGRKVKKKSGKLAKGLAICGIIFTILSPLRVGYKEATPAEYIPAGYRYETVSTDNTVLDYSVDGTLGGIASPDVIVDVLGFGDYVINTGGMVINSNSLLSGSQSRIRDGECQITGISVVDNRTNRILAFANVNQDNVPDDVRGANFGTYIGNVLRENGINRSDVSIRFHLGRVRDDYEGIVMRNHGWVDSTQLYNGRCYDEAIMQRAVLSQANLTGTINYFEGDSIVINGVTIPVKGADGRFFAPGTKVVGSNGHEYIINSLNATTTHEEHQEYGYHEASYTEATPGHPVLSYNITDGTLVPLVLGFASAKLANVIKNRKKKKDDEEESERSDRSGSDGRRSRDDSGRSTDPRLDPVRPFGPDPDLYSEAVGFGGRADASGLDALLAEIHGPEEADEGHGRGRH